MSKINDGGAAFPSEGEGKYHSPGMTLRDWFAGQVINGLMAGRQGASIQKQFAAIECDLAYEYADAMLSAREVKP